MPNHFYAMLSRMKNIYRWGLMRNSKFESLSEHTLEVSFISHALAIIGNKRLNKNYDANKIAVCAMFHDTSEILTGDMPTPVKYYNEEIKTAYKQIEKAAEEKLNDMLPSDLREDFYPLYNPNDEEKAIIKAADKISAYIKCIEETNFGNKEFNEALKSTKTSIEKLNVKEADIFLDEFIESFYLPLDSQTNN